MPLETIARITGNKSFFFCCVITEAREIAGEKNGSASTELPGQLPPTERVSRARVQ